MSTATAPAILIVDDDALTLQALQETLIREGYRIFTANDGIQAIALLKEQTFAVILCDQFMPGVSGVEVLKQALVLQPKAIRIVLTGMSDLHVVAELVNIGQISHFLLKPWDPTSLVQVVRNSVIQFQLIEENQRLAELNAAQHAQLQKNHDLLQQDLQIGGRIQEVLLMGKTPFSLPEMEIHAEAIPSREIDGDFFAFFQPYSEILDIAIGDVMGKGLPAALVGTAVKTQLTRFALPSHNTQLFNKQKGWRHELLSPDEIIAAVHNEIADSLIELEYFVTLFYGRFDLHKKTFTFVDCGAPKPLHYSISQKKITSLSGNNLPLGITKKELFCPHEIPIEKDDLFVFYSDGITEARSPEGNLYGTERLKELLFAHGSQRVSSLVTLIKESITAFTKKETWDDDMTLIIIRMRKEGVAPQPVVVKSSKFISDLSQLQPLRNFVSQLCLQAPGDSQRLSQHLQLAINEAFCNIVKHSYAESNLGEIVVKGELAEQGVIFELSDKGRPFNPTKIDEPSFAGDRENGFGLYLIKEAADELSYTAKKKEGDWNHLRIVKRYFSNEEKMEIEHLEKDDILLIIPEGDNLDAKEAPQFKQKIIDLITNSSKYRVVLDLHHLHFIDSSGLGSFLSLLRVVNSHGGDLKIAAMTKPIRTIFELVCMHKIFEIYNTTEEATRSFK